MILLEHVSKRFGDALAVADLSLAIQPGEIFACLGPNAAGKTTTIRMLVGLLRPTAGRIAIGGHDLAAQPQEAKRLLAYIPDQPFLYEQLTGREFLEFVGQLYGINGADQGRRIEAWLATFGLDSAQEMLIESYSHGMRQRLSYCAAFLHEPRVLVLDEPMVGLDPKAARLVKEALRQQATQDGLTVFLSTHVLSVAEEVADRIGIIDHGHLVALGTLPELRSRAGSTGQLEEVFLRLTGGAPQVVG